MISPWMGADLWSTKKLVRDVVERKERDRHLESVQTLCLKKFLHVYLYQKAELAVKGECAAQKRSSEAEAEMDKNMGSKQC